MSSSTDGAVRSRPVAAVLPELREGHWTRLGTSEVLGDQPTETLLGKLAESTRSAARAQGYTTGWAEGRREAAAEADLAEAGRRRDAQAREDRRDQEHQAALATLHTAAAALAAAAESVREAVEAQALTLARELTESLVGHELRTAEELGLDGADLARRALAALANERTGAASVTLRVGAPGLDASSVAELAQHGVEVSVDAALAPGDALAETDASAIDLRVGTALARVRAVLA